MPSPAPAPHAPAPAPARSQPPWAPPSGTGSAGRAPARWVLLGGGTWTCSMGYSPRMLQRPAQQGGRVPPRPCQGGRVPCSRDSKVMPTAPLLCCGSNVRRHLSARASGSSSPSPQTMEAPHNVSGAALRETLPYCPAALASCLTPHPAPLLPQPGLPAWVPSRHCS